MTKRRGLGKGLSDMGLTELLSDTPVKTTQPSNDNLKQLPVEFLQPGRYQPRVHFDEQALNELSDSIKSQGLIQPLVVRKVAGNKKYEIIAGERRWRAAQKAGLAEVPVVIKNIDDTAALAMALIENVQRQDLNPIEQSVSLQRLIAEFDMTHQQVAELVGKSRTSVTNLLRLLNLTPDVRKYVEKGELEMGHARALLALDDSRQSRVAHHIMNKKLSVREAERFVRALQKTPETGKAAGGTSPDVLNLQRSLADKVGAPVKLDYNAKGKGKLIIQFSSLDELESVLSHIK